MNETKCKRCLTTPRLTENICPSCLQGWKEGLCPKCVSKMLKFGIAVDKALRDVDDAKKRQAEAEVGEEVAEGSEDQEHAVLHTDFMNECVEDAQDRLYELMKRGVK
jgi:hypothetical protein